MTNEEAREHMDMLIAHKDKAIETHPYFKRCDNCIHSEEQDGGSCYECVKNMADNFEAQPTSDDDIIKALKAVRTIHNGNYAPQIDEAIRRLEAQPGEDAISRSELLRHQHIIYDDDEEGYKAVYVKDIKALPSVTPTNEDIKEAYLKGYDYGVKDWFKSKTQPCEDCISRAEVQDLMATWLSDYLSNETREALETIDGKVGDMPSVTPQRPKGKWIKVDPLGTGVEAYMCSECKTGDWDVTIEEYKFCPYCGAEMED